MDSFEHHEMTELPKQKRERFNQLLNNREIKLTQLTHSSDAELFHDRVNIELDFTNQHDTLSFITLTSLEKDMREIIDTDLGNEIGITKETMIQRSDRINTMKEKQQDILKRIERVSPTIRHADKVLVTLHQIYSGGPEIKFTPTQMAMRENRKANGTMDTKQVHMSGTTENDQNSGVTDITLHIEKRSESTAPGFHIAISKTYADGTTTVSIYDYNAISGDLSLDGKSGATLGEDLANKLIERIMQAENARMGRSSIDSNLQHRQAEQGAEKRLKNEITTM